MLYLKRKEGQDIEVWTPDGTVTVRVVKRDRGGVLLGIDAPPSVKVHRKEVADAIRSEGRA